MGNVDQEDTAVRIPVAAVPRVASRSSVPAGPLPHPVLTNPAISKRLAVTELTVAAEG
ncbi:hypothetical protein Raf01_87220 [Rugosimonospora africana]|uniref:Uncharacterized protein n=1 Tax=Rugosimonospora africana TaxID=556532 RepID=A0A8J3R057_9ACTN|nr:hypothetical protein Raf01_87220 [Rugosimonospora africana]